MMSAVPIFVFVDADHDDRVGGTLPGAVFSQDRPRLPHPERGRRPHQDQPRRKDHRVVRDHPPRDRDDGEEALSRAGPKQRPLLHEVQAQEARDHGGAGQAVSARRDPPSARIEQKMRDDKSVFRCLDRDLLHM
jgi:predicted acylesterase/phospholipase RssA